MAEHKTQLAVIGGGPGGYPAAFHASDLGLETLLIDEEKNPGGVCLYRGCIPSKALLHVAKIVREAKHAAQMGVHFADPRIDVDEVRAWGKSVIERLTSGLGAIRKQKKVKHLQGRAVFLDAHTLEVTLADGKKDTVRFAHAIIATGSRPAIPKAFDLGSDRIMDSTSALALPDIPKKMLVIGGGYIGLELGSVYAALGSEVWAVEMMKNLLPGADVDLVRVLAGQVSMLIPTILTDTKVAGLKLVKNGVQVTFEGAKAPDKPVRFDKVLVAVGRTPNSSELGLENVRVGVDEKGFIDVDARRRTAEPNIFAIGDVAGEPGLAHKATHEGKIAAQVIAGKDALWEPRAIPAVVFTDPEVAWVGVTEAEAKQRNLLVKVARFPWSASGRATTFERNDGLTKIIAEERTGRVVGIGMVGVGAGDMISEGALALEMGATVEDIAGTIHPHPTLSETIMEAADVYFGHSAHFAGKG